MCGIVGIVNYKKNIKEDRELLKNMLDLLKQRGPDEDGMFFDNNVNLGHKRLSIIDIENGKQPMSYKYNETTYTIVYNGQIYNTKELKRVLEFNGFEFETHSDTEILLKAYVYYGKNVCEHLNGIFAFAIWDDKLKELYLARDHFGIKPLYYTIKNGNFIFASEIKAILKHPEIKTIVDKEGICELFGVGPSHSPGKTPFKDIYELEPAHFMVLNKNIFYKTEYWKLKTKFHSDDLDTTCEKIRELVVDSVERQLVSDRKLCVLLSGGLDSSIITAISSNYYQNHGKRLDTFSVDYVDQEKNFVKNDFQPNADNYYIDLMVKEYKTNHTKIVLDTPELYETLEESMIARDFPGMADVDSSYLLFFREIVKHNQTVALSGECADEIFGGYPWYFREDSINCDTFPWSIALDERQKLLNPQIAYKTNLKDYVKNQYDESLKKIEILEEDSKETKIHRKLIYLTSNWFMQTLLDRTDRMSMKNGFEVRVPFCDYRIVEYAWNIPWEMKAYKGREKGLLRKAMEGYLPEEIIYRKKSPYPKTHNPSYLKKVKDELYKIIINKNSKINTILNSKYIMEILETDGKAFTRPWFGQLMTGPQLMAYLIQVELWLQKYNPEIEV